MQLAKETSAGHVGSEVRWQTSLRGIAKKATENKTHQFGNLYQLLNHESLHEAFHDFLRSTHLVCAFKFKQEAVKFYQEVGERLEKFGLALAEEKTNIIIFSRFRKEEKTRFEFLGLEFRWGVFRKGKAIIKRGTAPEKLRKSLAAFKQWCKVMRCKSFRSLFPKIIAKLRGYTNYYGLTGNFSSLSKFYNNVKKI